MASAFNHTSLAPSVANGLPLSIGVTPSMGFSGNYGINSISPSVIGSYGSQAILQVEKGIENVVFRTYHEERGRVVFQMGTSDVVRALSAAQVVCKDVAAVDINMVNPKSFSSGGAMAASLLTKLELIHDVFIILKRNMDTLRLTGKRRKVMR
ncbi:hypothetical protein F0562_012039 [Nyssa sinensis]|uniref:DUS-like FMN-binding domain-containing protein n=1 Tax=Nyssa sinensis TaxID=561372 RepID=A0A5J4ZTI9_9ASTE|nr:hypothetical protein F0562_012039 [Nyssa sinensis]